MCVCMCVESRLCAKPEATSSKFIDRLIGITAPPWARPMLCRVLRSDGRMCACRSMHARTHTHMSSLISSASLVHCASHTGTHTELGLWVPKRKICSLVAMQILPWHKVRAGRRDATRVKSLFLGSNAITRIMHNARAPACAEYRVL